MCVFMCTCVDCNMHMWVSAFTCTLQDRRATPLSSQLWPTYSYTHSADPTSVHAACSGHCGSTHLLPHTHTKWATAGLSSLHTTGCSFTLMKCKVSADSIFTHIIHTDKCTITQKLLFPPFFRSYSFKRAVEELHLHAKALLACANLLHVTTMAKKETTKISKQIWNQISDFFSDFSAIFQA